MSYCVTGICEETGYFCLQHTCWAMPCLHQPLPWWAWHIWALHKKVWPWCKGTFTNSRSTNNTKVYVAVYISILIVVLVEVLTLLICIYLFACRNFRCDCGNSKFGVFRCQLSPVSVLMSHLPLSHVILTAENIDAWFPVFFFSLQGKDRQNAKNHYNHNFHGCYCTCDRPYPDTDDQMWVSFQPLCTIHFLHHNWWMNVLFLSESYALLIC